MRLKNSIGYTVRGQTMIEVLVALGAAVIIISSITVAVITSVNNTSFSTNQNKATQLAQEGLDAARELRDSDYTQFVKYDELTKCLGEDKIIPPPDDTTDSCSDRPNVGQFVRTVFFQNDDSQGCGKDLTRVESVVSWSDSKCSVSDKFCHSVKLVSCFSQFGTIPNP